MGKFVNVADILIIGVSAYIVIWGANRILRTTGLSAFQA